MSPPDCTLPLPSLTLYPGSWLVGGQGGGSGQAEAGPAMMTSGKVWSQEWAETVVTRWRNIYIRGGRRERLTADNQLPRQSDSKEMMELIKIFLTTATPSCQTQNFRLMSAEPGAVHCSVVATTNSLLMTWQSWRLDSEDVASQLSFYLGSDLRSVLTRNEISDIS